MTTEEICELMDITPRHWNRLLADGVVFHDANGKPDLKRSMPSYIRYLRDGTTSEDSRERKRIAEASIAERKDAEAAGDLVPRSEYESNYAEAVTQICLKVSRMKDLTADKVIAAIQNVELAPLEFAREEQ